MTQRILLISIVLVVAILGGGLWLALQSDPGTSRSDLDEELLPGPSAPEEPRRVPDQLPRMPQVDENEGIPEEARTTVVIPLEIDFELIEATGRLSADGLPALGSAATAKLRGTAHRQDGHGMLGEVEFIAGPNRGRILETDSRGAFGANDLYPGLSLVAITGAGVPGAEREVLLRAGRLSELPVGFGRPAVVFGQVRDEQNNPLPFADVSMDGQQTKTDEAGIFRFIRMSSGKVPVYISKAGYASVREMSYITASTTIALGKLKYVLRPAATLSVSVADRLGTGGPGTLILSGTLEPRPGLGDKARTYPWHLKSPATIYAGETIEIEDLPAGRVRLQLFVPGAIVEPKTQTINLIAGQGKHAAFHLKAAPILTGQVTLKGEPVERALVRLEAPDVTLATQHALGGEYGRATIEMEILGQVPPAVQQVFTGSDGRFQFSAAEEIALTRYLTARAPDGQSWAGRVIQEGEREIDLALQPAEKGRGSLVIETSTRHQALPVEYVINGKPDAVTLPVGEPLRVDDLPEGVWRYSVRWGNEVLQKSIPVEIDGKRELFIPLPQGAIDGQAKALRDSLRR